MSDDDELADLRPVMVDERLLRRIVVRLAVGEAVLLVPADIPLSEALPVLGRALRHLEPVNLEVPADV